MDSFERSVTKPTPLSPMQIADLLDHAGVRHVTHVVPRPDRTADRAGVDYVAHRYGRRRALNIDVKVLKHSPRGDDPEILLEVAAQGRECRPGWANDSTKKTDLYLIVYGTGGALVLSARQVRGALHKYGSAWMQQFRTGRTQTRGYYEDFSCEYVLVPLSVLTAGCAEVARSWQTKRLPGL